jgi:hypothetical protein
VGKCYTAPDPSGMTSRWQHVALCAALYERVPVMTVKTVHRGLLITAVAGGLMLASQPLASAAVQPAAIPTPASFVKDALPVSPPVAGGQVDSVVGIGGGAVRGILPVAGLPGI